MKVYKFFLKASDESEYIAAETYNRAMQIFCRENKVNNTQVKGEMLLKKNPASSRDGLEIELTEGIIPENIEFEYFAGEKRSVQSINPNLREFIQREIAKQIKKYFENEVTFLS